MQIVLNGLISGLGIAIVAVGFQLVYLPTRVFFIGLAALYSVAPYVYSTTQATFGQWPLSVAASLACVVGLALIFEWLNHRPLTHKNASEGVHLISSLGIYILLVQTVVMIWGNQPQSLRKGVDIAMDLGPFALTQSQLIVGGTSSVLLLAFLGLLRTTDFGLKLRALSDNPRQFALLGYNLAIYRALAFGLAGVFATAASLPAAADIGFGPFNGLHAFFLSVVAVMIGGRNSYLGPIAAAILLGLIRAQVAWHLSPRWQDAVTFGLLGLFLLFRPQGLLGKKTWVEGVR